MIFFIQSRMYHPNREAAEGLILLYAAIAISLYQSFQRGTANLKVLAAVGIGNIATHREGFYRDRVGLNIRII